MEKILLEVQAETPIIFVELPEQKRYEVILNSDGIFIQCNDCSQPKVKKQIFMTGCGWEFESINGNVLIHLKTELKFTIENYKWIGVVWQKGKCASVGHLYEKI